MRSAVLPVPPVAMSDDRNLRQNWLASSQPRGGMGPGSSPASISPRGLPRGGMIASVNTDSSSLFNMAAAPERDR
jgi:hypothetical protein